MQRKEKKPKSTAAIRKHKNHLAMQGKAVTPKPTATPAKSSRASIPVVSSKNHLSSSSMLCLAMGATLAKAEDGDDWNWTSKDTVLITVIPSFFAIVSVGMCAALRCGFFARNNVVRNPVINAPATADENSHTVYIALD